MQGFRTYTAYLVEIWVCGRTECKGAETECWVNIKPIISECLIALFHCQKAVGLNIFFHYTTSVYTKLFMAVLRLLILHTFKMLIATLSYSDMKEYFYHFL
jgi:hypothetical protein